MSDLTLALHALGAALPRHDHAFARADLPANGLYFFFERGETVEVNGQVIDRIVRIGTHKKEGRLPGRLGDHFAGNRRGSVFRLHLGGALLNREHPADCRLAAWVGQKGGRMPEVEQVVSEALQERFGFCCIQVDDTRERLDLERGLIAILSRHPLSPPSPDWLGRHAVHPTIRESGLWNTRHVGAEPHEQEQLARIAELACAPVPPVEQAALAPPGQYRRSAVIRVGDRVRLTTIPPDVAALADDRDELGTKAVFQACLGRVFTVRDIDRYGNLELWVHGGDDGHPRAYLESIWVEPEFVAVVGHDDAGSQ